MRAAIYARVSSEAQQKKETIDAQLRLLRGFIKKRRPEGWELVNEYQDDGRSGTKVEGRESFQRCLRDAEAGKFEVLVLRDIDRLTRTDKLGERLAILGRLQEAGVILAEAESGRISDLRSSTDELLALVKAWAAADVNKRRLADCRRGKHEAVRKGRKPAGRTPFGYTFDKDTGKWGHHPENAALVRWMFEQCANGGPDGQGISLDLIALALHERGVPTVERAKRWTFNSVWRILKNPVYKGEYTYRPKNEEPISFSIDCPIVEVELWEKAQRERQRRHAKPLDRTKRQYLLRGLVRCGHCGASMHIQGTGEARYYVCRVNAQQYRWGDCPNRYHRTARVDELVWKTVAQFATNRDLLDAAIRQAQDTDQPEPDVDRAAQIVELQRKLEGFDKRQARVLIDYQRGRFSEDVYHEALDRHEKDRVVLLRTIQVARQQLEMDRHREATQQRVQATVEQLAEQVRTADFARRRSILQTLVRHIDLKRDEPPVIHGVLPLEVGEALSIVSCSC